MERPNAADAIPGVGFKWFFAFAFIAFQKSGNKEFFGQRRQLDASRLAVTDHLVRVIEADDFHRGTFRVRGDVIDVFPAEEEHKAVRIELERIWISCTLISSDLAEKQAATNATCLWDTR